MAHQRDSIRDAIVSLLSGNTDAGTNVFKNRVINFQKTQLPCIDVTTKTETAQPRALAGNQYIRKIELNIRIFVDGTSNIDDIIDDISEDIEGIMFANTTLSGTATGCVYTGITTEIEDGGSRLVGLGTMSFEITYIT